MAFVVSSGSVKITDLPPKLNWIFLNEGGVGVNARG